TPLRRGRRRSPQWSALGVVPRSGHRGRGHLGFRVGNLDRDRGPIPPPPALPPLSGPRPRSGARIVAAPPSMAAVCPESALLAATPGPRATAAASPPGPRWSSCSSPWSPSLNTFLTSRCCDDQLNPP